MSLPTNLPDLPTFSLHVTVHIRPTDVEAFFRTMQPCFEAVTAEPECVYFEIYQDPEDSGKISWVENWNATPEWLMTVQLQREYYQPYFEKTLPMYVKEREYRILRRSPYCVQKEGNVK